MSSKRLIDTKFYIKDGFLYKRATWVYTEEKDWEHIVYYIFDTQNCEWQATISRSHGYKLNNSIKNTQNYDSEEQAFVKYYQKIYSDNFKNYKFLDLIAELKLNKPELFL